MEVAGRKENRLAYNAAALFTAQTLVAFTINVLHS
jgi:hypothetical protein